MQKRNTKQYNLALFLFLLPLLVVSLHSCEYNSGDDNFVFLEKPGEEVQIGIELSGINPAEVIYVYNHTEFSYSLNTGGKDIFLRQFFLDGQPIETDQYSGVGYLSTDITDNEIHELKLLIALNTGTGSLAEYAGYEMYAGEFTFQIKIISYSNELNIRETTDQNNYLKLVWDKPKDYEVWGYEVYDGDLIFRKLLAVITNPDETFFTDTDFAYGYKHYTIVAYVKNSFDITVTDNIIVSHANMTEEHFEMHRTSLNEALIRWNNPNAFPCKYVLVYGYDKKMIIEDGVSEATIPVNKFPSWNNSFTLYVFPKSADNERYNSYSYVHMAYNDKWLNVISFKEDIKHNMLHCLTYASSLDSYDMTTMEKIGSVNYNPTDFSNNGLQITKEGAVAISEAGNYVNIYSDYSLENKINSFNTGGYPFRLVNGNKLLIGEQSGFKLYDIATGDVICTKTWQPNQEGNDITAATSISPDGKYIAVNCHQYNWPSQDTEWIEFYEIKTDHSLQFLGKIETADIQSVSFHPLKSSTAVIQYVPYKQYKFEIKDILTKEQKEIKGEFMNIDPFTGNLLFKGDGYLSNEPVLYVFDNNFSKEIIRIELDYSNSTYASYLLNNYLFNSNRYMNLQGLKEWNP